MGALLALPALWVDHEPLEIADGLLSVIGSVLGLDSVYARFDDPHDPLEVWRPSGPRPPDELQPKIAADGPSTSGLTTVGFGTGSIRVRITSLPLALPWGTGLVLAASQRESFPTETETHLLRVAVSQAAIAIHTARRLTREHAARAAAESGLRRQTAVLSALVDDVEPALSAAAQRLREAARLVAESSVDPVSDGRRVSSERARLSEDTSTLGPRPSLTRRETEVLGLLAQGLSNKEIAGVMWLSDRTIERHITSLYRKIGVVRRSEATAFAFHNGIG
ncbi:helix-turn-helix transcriptional regulator [Microbacterium yannicii]|uniref:helix-turn-helix transcriptional regulator n=1 Tax=Microbacterium yannicii TaxID=671622 RepID=UPI0002E11B1C|nr:LuxR C-terminal-related transcriptional regulator [Microbacterium yannicii]